jgi:hypothetical protein
VEVSPDIGVIDFIGLSTDNTDDSKVETSIMAEKVNDIKELIKRAFITCS